MIRPHRRLPSGTFAAVAAVAVVVCVASTPISPAADTEAGAAGSVRQPTTGNLVGVDLHSPDRGWAVGSQRTDGPLGLAPLIERWDGRDWTSSYAPGHDGATLTAVHAISATNAWAVGAQFNTDATLTSTAVALNWNGRHWRSLPTATDIPNGQFYGVSASSAHDVWAVGSDDDGMLIEHWTGQRWTAVPGAIPNGSVGTALHAVEVIGPNDVWATGDYASADKVTHALIEHWNGHRWRMVAAALPADAGTTLLSSISARSTRDVWSVGLYDTATGSHTLIEHWNGTGWRVVAAPEPTAARGGFAELYSVSVNRDNDVWSVGTSSDGCTEHTLTEHWDGSRWRVVRSPDQGGPNGYDLLFGVSARAGFPTAVGVYSTDGTSTNQMQLPVTLRWDGSRWVRA